MMGETCSSLSGEFVTVEQIFRDGLKIDENKYSNVWLTDLPDLAEECRTKFIASVVGEVVVVGGEVFQVGNVTFKDIAQLITPINLSRQFPIQCGPNKISRILLRREFIKRWNRHIDSLNVYGCSLLPNEVVLSAAVGLGKSVYLYLCAVFAKHCKIPVQYIANTSAWLGDKDMSKVVSLYLKMLLFMNADILDYMPNFQSTDYEYLNGVPLKHAIYFAMRQQNISLAMDIRKTMIQQDPHNFLIIDEHNVLWRDFGGDIFSWPDFVRFYTDLRVMSTAYCGVLIAGSQHHEFEDNLPGGYEDAKDYVEPLNFKEFEAWQGLPDYPEVLRQRRQEVIELTGLVPRLIVEMVSIARNNENCGFKELTRMFRSNNYPMMKRKHDQFVMSLKKKVERNNFLKMLRFLFLGDSAPEVCISEVAYLARGLLITMRNGSLRFYNTKARDILFDTFSSYFLTSDSFAELSKKFKNTLGSFQSLHFEQKFFLWCLHNYSSWQLYLREHQRTIKFESNKCIRLDGMQFNPLVSKVTDTCWMKISEIYPRLDFAYVDVRDDGWNLYLMQASMFSFPDHNRNESSRIELLFEPPDRPQLASLLNLFFSQTDFQVSTVRDESDKIVNFTVTDSNGNSYRDQICILYITPQTKQKARVLEAPSYVECVTLEDFPENCKRYLGLPQIRGVKKRTLV